MRAFEANGGLFIDNARISVLALPPSDNSNPGMNLGEVSPDG